MLEISCGQQDHTSVLYKPAAGFPFSGNSLFWKSGAKTARLIYVTNRNQTLIATFNKQRTAPRALVWRWLMLPSPHPTAPSLCHGPQGPKPGCFVLHCDSSLVTRPGWSSYLWVSLMREVTQNYFRKQRSKLRATDVEYLNKIIKKKILPATWESKPEWHTLALLLQSVLCGRSLDMWCWLQLTTGSQDSWTFRLAHCSFYYIFTLICLSYCKEDTHFPTLIFLILAVLPSEFCWIYSAVSHYFLDLHDGTHTRLRLSPPTIYPNTHAWEKNLT